jgi:hypothetical protein
MYIYPKHTGPMRPETTTQTGDVSESAAVKPIAPAPSGAERSDKVEISDAGRALAARGADSTQASSGPDSARNDRIRGRILSGAYDTLEVVDTVARRLLDSGDL